MIKSVTAKNYLGEEVKIVLTDDEPKHGLLLKSIDGLGPAKAAINTTSLVTSDGSFYNSSRLEERNIKIAFYFFDDIEEARNLTYKYFPIKRYVDLIIETTEKTLRTRGYVESNEPDIFSKQETTNISIICPDPYFYDAGPNGITTTVFSGIDGMFEFPFDCNIVADTSALLDDASNPIKDNNSEPINGTQYGEIEYIEFGQINTYPSRNIEYIGDAEVGIKIYMHMLSMASNIAIYDLTTRETFKLNADFKSGDDIIINTKRGEKSVTLIRNSIEYNIINTMAMDSTWFVLHKGKNLFTFKASTGTENIEVRIENETVYEGV